MSTIKANYLFIIPARKGSKGIPNKNTKLLNGKPLINYTLDYASKVSTGLDKVCITTDDNKVKELAKKYDFDILKRPSKLATDSSSMNDVVKHVIEKYNRQGIFFKAFIILQPTSPIRHINDFNKIELLYTPEIDMVVSVRKARENPYYLLYEENSSGFIAKSKELIITRRQDAPEVYCLNGSIFMINPKSLDKSDISNFKKLVKFEMPYERSTDIDDSTDWLLTEIFLKNKNMYSHT
mgnify:CR=1 FL=1